MKFLQSFVLRFYAELRFAFGGGFAQGFVLYSAAQGLFRPRRLEVGPERAQARQKDGVCALGVFLAERPAADGPEVLDRGEYGAAPAVCTAVFVPLLLAGRRRL